MPSTLTALIAAASRAVVAVERGEVEDGVAALERALRAAAAVEQVARSTELDPGRQGRGGPAVERPDLARRRPRARRRHGRR